MQSAVVSERRHDNWICAGVAVAYATFVFALLPSRVVPMNDDFAYYRSIAATLQHGQPWTDEWLEPWAFSLSVLGAMVFKLTGSFFGATIGLQTLFAAISAFFLTRVCRDQGMSRSGAAIAALALLTFPTVLWKHLEFTALALHIPCLLIAIWAYRRNQWATFFIAWAIAVASRQSAVAWLALPAVVALQHGWRSRSAIASWRLLSLVAAGGAWFWFLSAYANETHAQRFITRNLWSAAAPGQTFVHLLLALWVVLVAVGCAAFVFSIVRTGSSSPRNPLRRALQLLVATGLVGTMFAVRYGVPLEIEHAGFHTPMAIWYARFLILLGAVGWATTTVSVRLAPLVTAAGLCFLSALRGSLWDYYLLDAALLVFLGTNHDGDHAAETSAKPLFRSWRVGLLCASCLIIALYHTRGSALLKRFVDYREGATVVVEKALRQGVIRPTELADMPFGLAAWHLFPYYISHEGRTSAALDGFGMYYERGTIAIQVETVDNPVDSTAAPTSGASLPLAEIHPFGWFGHARFTLVRLKDSATSPVALRGDEYRAEPFPLDDAEWRRSLTPP